MESTLKLFSRYRAVGADCLNHVRHTAADTVEFLQIFCNDGCVLAGAKVLPMLDGAVYVIDCAEPHCTAPLVPKKYVRNNLSLSKSAFEAFLKTAGARDILAEVWENGVMCAALSKEAAKQADECFACLDRLCHGQTDMPEVCLALLTLTLLLKKHADGNIPADTGLAGQAVAYVETNLGADVSTAAVARALHVSKYHLCHTFHARTGMTLSRYVLEKRLTEAEKLLCRSTLSVSEISEELGFASISYFCGVFGKKYGVPPGVYRKTAQLRSPAP